MARGKRHTAEQIVSLLRQIEVAVANGKTTPVVCRESQRYTVTRGQLPGCSRVAATD
jgi:hypothetical protein